MIQKLNLYNTESVMVDDSIVVSGCFLHRPQMFKLGARNVRTYVICKHILIVSVVLVDLPWGKVVLAVQIKCNNYLM